MGKGMFGQPRLALLADDLTGACDAGVQFSDRGFSSVVLLGERTPKRCETDLVICSSNSRDDPPDAAREKVTRFSELFQGLNRTLVFKKIDSTLRGNLGPEIQAAMAHWHSSLAVVAPSFPAMGRSLEGGWLRGSAAALASPIHLPTLLAEQGVANVIHFDQSVFREGLDSLAGRFQSLASSGPGMVVVDAVVQAQLSLLARAAMSLEPHALVVGSAGLAAEVAAIHATQYHKKNRVQYSDAKSASEPRPVALFIGSTHPATAAQVEYLLSSRAANRMILQDCLRDIARCANENHRYVVVSVTRTDEEGRVGQVASRLCELGYRAFILSGGDTAYIICKALNVEGIELEREVAPGLPWGRILGGPAEGLPIVTKAGGFGDKEALAVAADFLAVCK